jgi:hypothetical protein
MASSSAAVEGPPTYVGVQVTDGVLRCAVPAAVLISGAAMLVTGVTNMFGAVVLAAGGTFGAAALFELLPMLGIGGGPTRPAASQLPSASTMVGMKEVIFS